MKNLISALAFLLLTIPCSAEIIIVDNNGPADFNSIWPAINYSHNGDYIIVFPGTYTGSGNVNLNLQGKAITLQSVDPTDPYIVAQTIIDCNGYDVPGFHFYDENYDSVVAGFTIKNGHNGIYCDAFSSPTIAYCTITGNEAFEGGGIYCYLSDPIIYYCTITANSAEYRGGGIYCEYFPPIIYGCTISGNNGTGVYCWNSAPIIYGCTITNNSYSGIFCDVNSVPEVNNCTIADNSYSGIFCDSDSKATISNCTISGNEAGRDGGGIYCEGDYDSMIIGSPTVTNCTISSNSAEDGGGIFCDSFSIPTITNCTITGNEASEGSGIYCMGDYGSMMAVSPKITNCTITDNSARSDGGGIYCDDSNATITNCTITGNSAGDGGGICGFHGGRPIVTGCIITGNSVWRDGGGIYCDSINYGLKVVNCTVTGNLAGSYGGGIYYVNNSYYNSILNSIVWGNADSTGTGQSAQVYSGNPNVWFSCIQDDNPDDVDVPFGEDKGNIDDDPCFVEPGSGYWDDSGTPEEPYDDLWVWSDGDYHLLPASPCIETGDPYYTYHANEVDMDAQPRLMGRRVDIGADEFEISVIVVTKPQAGVVWAAGSTHKIKWDSFSITGTVDISYSTNNGADWVIIENSVADTGSFLWHLPVAVDSNQCLVSVEPTVPVSNLICTPSGLFTIHPCPPGPLVASKWKSLGGDFDRSGLSQDSGPELGCVKWQFQTNGPVSASPTVGADGRVHLACEDGNLYTLDANGQLLWSYDTNSPLLSSPSIGPDGSVYVGAENGTLFAIDVNGNLRWTHSTDGFIYSSPAISADGNIFVCSQDGSLYALAQDGSELWTFETDGVSSAVTGAIFASPAIGPDGTIYIAGFYDPNLYALNPADGSVKRSCTFLDLDPLNPNPPKLRPFVSPVVAPNGTIYQTVLSNPKRLIEDAPWDYIPYWYDSKLYAIDSNTGNILWATNMTETPTQTERYGPPEPDYWFRQYYASADTHNEAPPYPYTATFILDFGFVRYCRVNNAGLCESALGPDGTIYTSFDDQYLRAVDPNGSIKWVTSLGWVGGFTLAVGSDGLIYAAAADGYLYVIDPDGKEVARFEGDNWLSFPVITADNTLILCDANNIVWAIGGDNCEGHAAALRRPADLNADWSVNFIDFAAMAAGWLDCTDTSIDPATKAPYCDDSDSVIFLESDINRDQYVDFADLADLTSRWLEE